MTAAAEIPDGEHSPLTRNQKLARVAIAAAIALIIAMWIYAFVFASETAVAKVADRAWAARAQEICVRRNDLLEKNATDVRKTGDGSPQSIGAGVASATDIVEAALNEVLAVTPPSAQDQKLIGEWTKLYRIYIADRRATETKLLAGEKVELNETTVNGSPISDSISDFTKPNLMEACSAPSGN